LGVFGHDTPML